MTRRRFFTAAAALAACALALAQLPPWGDDYPGCDEASNVATGDITSVTINADGWTASLVCAGFTTGATYDYGIGTTDGAVTSSKMVFTITSLGYDSAGNATTIVRTAYGVKAERKPYPNHATLDETGGGNLTVPFVLSMPIFAKDNTGAGNSGTAPTVTIAAGLITNTGGSSETSNAVTDLTVTNNSTLAYPKCIGHFAIEDARPVNGTHDIEVVGYQAFAKNKCPVARVAVSATGGSSSHVESGAATAMTKSTRADALPVYAIPLNLSVGAGFTRGEAVTVRFTLYPWVGDSTAILDSTTDAGASTFQLQSLVWTIMDKVIAVVDAGSGNDTTGVASPTQATADAAPCATIGGALTKIAAYNNSTYSLNRVDGGEVQLVAGSYDLQAKGAQASTYGYWTLTHQASTNQAGVVIGYTDHRYLYHRERFYDITLTPATSGKLIIQGTAADYAVLEKVNFNGTLAASWFTGGTNTCLDFMDCTWDNGHFLKRANDYHGRLVRNGTFTPTTQASGDSAMGSHLCILGNDWSGTTEYGWRTLTSQGTTNVVIAYNTCMNKASGINIYATGDAFNGVAIVCNLFERIGASADNHAETSDQNHANVLVWHNTWAGQRWNHENDITSPYVNKTFTNWYLRYNCLNARGDHRADIRDTDGSMVGTWWIGYSVGCSDNHNEGIAYAGDSDFFGIRSNTPYANAISPTVPAGFVNDKSRSGSDDGNGDYTPDVGSILRSRIPAGECVIPFDINGRAYNNYGLGDIGAIQHFIPTGGKSWQDWAGGFGE